MKNELVSSNAFDVAFDIQIDSVEDPGDLAKERLIIGANRICITEHWIIQQQYDLSGKVPVIGKAFFIPVLDLQLNDLLHFWSKRGVDREDAEVINGAKSRHFYLNQRSPMWSGTKIPYLLQLQRGHGARVPNGFRDNVGMFGGSGVGMHGNGDSEEMPDISYTSNKA